MSLLRAGPWPAFAVTLLSAAWAICILVTPFAIVHRAGDLAFRAAVTIYLIGGAICHQRPERSFYLSSIKMPVCARCSGLYLAAPVGALLGLARRRAFRVGAVSPRAMIVLIAVPTALTLAAEWLGLAHVSNTERALAALPLGAGIASLITAALRER